MGVLARKGEVWLVSWLADLDLDIIVVARKKWRRCRTKKGDVRKKPRGKTDIRTDQRYAFLADLARDLSIGDVGMATRTVLHIVFQLVHYPLA